MILKKNIILYHSIHNHSYNQLNKNFIILQKKYTIINNINKLLKFKYENQNKLLLKVKQDNNKLLQDNNKLLQDNKQITKELLYKQKILNIHYPFY